MNKKILLMMLSMVLVSTHSIAKVDKFGDWRVSIDVNDFTDEVTASAWSSGGKKYNDYKSIGLRCIDKNINITFDTVSYISSNNSYITLKARVDKKPTEVFVGKLYSNSHSSGWTPNIASDKSGIVKQKIKINSFIKQMKKGNKLLIEASNVRRSNIEQVAVSLKGFTKAYNSINAVCN